MSKAIFDGLFKRSHPKGIAFAFSYRNPAVPIEEQRKGKPAIFFKQLSTMIKNPQEVKLYSTWPIKYEVELGFMINRSGRNLTPEEALYHVGGYFLLIDFTATELFNARQRGEAWCIYKNDDNYFPISSFIEKDKIKNPDNLDLELRINGEVKQKANTSELIWNIPDLISQTSKYVTLNEGDLFLTGTPAGSNPVNQGDRIYATLTQGNEVLTDLNFTVKLDGSKPHNV